MITRYTYRDLTWIDLESPTRDEVRSVMEEYRIHPIVANELLSPTVRPKVDPYDNFIYLLLHFPAVTHHHGKSTEQEVDFIVGKKFIITTHYELIDPLHEFSKMFEVNSLLDKGNMGEHGGYLFYYIIREMYRALGMQLDTLSERLEEIEARIFAGDEVGMVEVISSTNRDLLNFKQATRYHKEVLESFELAGRHFYGQDFSYHLRAITGEYYKVASVLEGHKEALLDLRDTNDSLLTTRTNEIMKVLTIMAFVTFPLSLIAGIFGMNTKEIPIVGMPHDFWWVIGIMVIGVVLMFAFFKYKKWL